MLSLRSRSNALAVLVALGSLALSAAPARAAKCPNVLVVLDRSGSMTTTMGTTTRWGAATGSLLKLVDLVEPLRAGRIGLSYFPNSGCDSATPVLPDYGTKLAISSALSGLSPSGSTPSGTAIRNAAMLSELRDPSRKQYVLLMTDGGPGCGGEPDSVSGTVAQLNMARLASPPINTFVVGIGTLSAAEQSALTQMADAGGRPEATAEKYYKATSQSELDLSLSKIALAIQSENAGCVDPVPTDMGAPSDLSAPRDLAPPVDLRATSFDLGDDMSLPPPDMATVDLRVTPADLREDDLSTPTPPDLSLPPDDLRSTANQDQSVPPADLSVPRDGGLVRPIVEWMAPRELPEGKGGTAVIRGANFATASPGPSVYMQSGVNLRELRNVLIEDAQTLRVVVPTDLEPGVYDVIVKNPDGQLGRLAAGFEITAVQLPTASGCACALGAGPTSTPAAPMLGALVLGLVAVRRRRRLRAG